MESGSGNNGAAQPALTIIPKSHLGFGTSALGGRTGKKESLRLLGTAFDAGIRYFDTAPLYGYGAAEEILGEFLEDKRSEVTLCTKFGIEPPKRSAVTDLVRSAARTLISVAPGLRAKISRQANALVKPGNFTIPHLEMSLQRSLNALQTSHLDILLMHEASPEEISVPLVSKLESLQQQGLIASYGLAALEHQVFGATAMPLPGQVLQLFDRSFRTAQASLPPQHLYITHSVFSAGLKAMTARIKADPAFARACSERLALDCEDTRKLGRLSLFAALRRNTAGVTLFSSLNAETIRMNATVMHKPEFDPEQALIFDQLSQDVVAPDAPRP